MKIWIRFLIGSAAGALLGLLLPPDSALSLSIIETISRIILRIGRYAVFPLLFFGMMFGAHRLSGRRLGGIYLKAAVAVVATTIMLITIGAVSVLLVSPERIPPIFQEAPPIPLPSIDNLADRILPTNLFAVFAQQGDYLLPIILIALLLGIAARYESNFGDSIMDIVDGLGRMVYRLISLLSEGMGIGLLALSAASIVRIRAIVDVGIFTQLIVLLLLNVLLIIFVIFPLLVRISGTRDGPFVWLYAIVAPALAGFFSGDSYFALPSLVQAGKENMGIDRSTAGVLWPFGAIFAKGGTAMIACTLFILILQSYSALEITVVRVLWVMVVTVGVSFAAGMAPSNGVLVTLSALAGIYGRGLEEAYLIILPIAPLLIGFGVLLDIVTVGFITYFVASMEKERKKVYVVDFV